MTNRKALLRVESLLAGAQLPALPQSAIRLLQLSQDPENGPAEFAVPIESDPGLTGQVLKFVNSSYFGFAREISSIRLAITLGGHSHDQELRSVERRVQSDAESQVRSVRLEEPLAGLVAPRAVCPRHGAPAGPGRQRGPVCGGLAAGHGGAAVGQGVAGRIRQAVPAAAEWPTRGCRISNKSGSAGITRRRRVCWPAVGACPRNSPT